jgi:hypothetical protein
LITGPNPSPSSSASANIHAIPVDPSRSLGTNICTINIPNAAISRINPVP